MVILVYKIILYVLTMIYFANTSPLLHNLGLIILHYSMTLKPEPDCDVGAHTPIDVTL